MTVIARRKRRKYEDVRPHRGRILATRPLRKGALILHIYRQDRRGAVKGREFTRKSKADRRRAPKGQHPCRCVPKSEGEKGRGGAAEKDL